MAELLRLGRELRSVSVLQKKIYLNNKFEENRYSWFDVSVIHVYLGEDLQHLSILKKKKGFDVLA